MRDTRYEEGFTLVELLVALMVTSIILAAVATLAYTLGAVNDAANDMAEKQAQVRFATLRISELIRHCKLICGTPGGNIAVWSTDESDVGKININELVYIEKGADSNCLKLCVFPSSATAQVNLSDIGTLASSSYSVTNVPLISQCINNSVEFQFDEDPPNSKFVSISFDLVENGVTRQYQISAALRGWAGNLLDGNGDIANDDD
jgi:prepilin-type N-terminal cleavage/methylation domain-containing protein